MKLGDKVNLKKTTSTVTTRTIETVDCRNLYKELQQLTLNLLEMIRGGHENSNHLSKLNKQIRSWIQNLYKECPPEQERLIITEYIQNEYSEYNT